MTDTEITPELLRSVATWLRDNAVGVLPGKPMAAEFLDCAADDLAREQAPVLPCAGRLYPNDGAGTPYTCECGASGTGVEMGNHLPGPRPRTWNDLRDVPGDVKTVEDRDGNRWYRPPGGWGACLPFTHAAPFTEVIADA